MISACSFRFPRRSFLLLAVTAGLSAAFVCAAESPRSFVQAKARADADESSLVSPVREAFLQSQSRQLEASVAACASPQPDLSPLTVVVELNARGKILRSWREGETPLAICVEKELLGRFLEAPPRAPFYASFELSFTP